MAQQVEASGLFHFYLFGKIPKDFFVDNWTGYLLVNHNMYSFQRTHFEACDLVFDAEKQGFSKVPGQLLEAVELIERYFLEQYIGAVERRLAELLENFK